MRVSDIADDLLRLAEDARDSAAEMLFEPRLALGVTGLSRAGKTVFITSLIANLLARGRMRRLSAEADGRLMAAMVRPHPDRETPRFDFESHYAALTGPEPVWPESTRRISQIRLSLRYRPTGLLAGLGGPGTLHLDIVDYPGEWLLDLSLLDRSYADWSQEALAQARGRADAAEWLALVDARDPTAALDEAAARRLAETYTAHLRRMREAGACRLTPGRFLTPGDLEGSPALSFCPLPDSEGRDPLRAEFAKRYDAYRRAVVKPFFRDHFARLDRQIVLVDLLSALDRGPAALADLGEAMTESLRAFRPGRNSWLASILGRRIDRILFAATKADHLHHHEHERMTAILTALLRDSVSRAAFRGAETDALAIASLRATAEQEVDGLRAVRGRRLSDRREIALDPGELPADPAALIAAARSGGETWPDGPGFEAVSFAPPPARGEGLPHIRLDSALEFLIGDRLT